MSVGIFDISLFSYLSIFWKIILLLHDMLCRIMAKKHGMVRIFSFLPNEYLTEKPSKIFGKERGNENAQGLSKAGGGFERQEW